MRALVIGFNSPDPGLAQFGGVEPVLRPSYRGIAKAALAFSMRWPLNLDPRRGSTVASLRLHFAAAWKDSLEGLYGKALCRNRGASGLGEPPNYSWTSKPQHRPRPSTSTIIVVYREVTSGCNL